MFSLKLFKKILWSFLAHRGGRVTVWVNIRLKPVAKSNFGMPLGVIQT